MVATNKKRVVVLIDPQNFFPQHHLHWLLREHPSADNPLFSLTATHLCANGFAQNAFFRVILFPIPSHVFPGRGSAMLLNGVTQLSRHFGVAAQDHCQPVHFGVRVTCGMSDENRQIVMPYVFLEWRNGQVLPGNHELSFVPTHESHRQKPSWSVCSRCSHSQAEEYNELPFIRPFKERDLFSLRVCFG